MGKNTKRVKEFIENIPDEKLTGFVESGGTIYKDEDFRLDMQGMTSDTPPKHNIQVQINRNTTITSLKKLAPQTVAHLLVPRDSTKTAAEIRELLIDAITV